MNDENIKEILDYYKKDAEKFEYLMKDYTEEQLKTTFSKNYQRYKNHKLLLDYITNLQQENERLNKEINNKEFVFVGTAQNKTRDFIKNLIKEKNDYKSRCEKVSEKINYYKYFISLTKSEEHMLNTLDNILQNGSEKDD